MLAMRLSNHDAKTCNEIGVYPLRLQLLQQASAVDTFEGAAYIGAIHTVFVAAVEAINPGQDHECRRVARSFAFLVSELLSVAILAQG